jgi:threonine dehydrogenase-like Zn-dependent dehydrogenase
VKVDACGICGTDVEEYTDGPIIVPTDPHTLSGRCAPLTLGHETVGVVDVAGEGASLQPGTRVAVEANIFCGDCFWCSHHQYQLCSSLASLGLMTDGGLAEYVLARGIEILFGVASFHGIDPKPIAEACPARIARHPRTPRTLCVRAGKKICCDSA